MEIRKPLLVIALLMAVSSSVLGTEYSSTEGSISGTGLAVFDLYIADAGTITDLNVRLNLDYAYQDGNRFLTVQLLSPYGNMVELGHGDQNGTSPSWTNTDGGDLYNTIFDDEASGSIYDGSTPFAGSFQPDGSLSDFDGQSITGTWQLLISYSTNYTGTIEFTIMIETTNTMTDIDGNVYETVQIGSQTWMAENLKVTHYRDGTEITNETDDAAWAGLTAEAYCIYNNNASNEVETYGALYNWYAAVDAHNIAPEGWHVPTDAEWKELEMSLGMSQSEADADGYRGTNEGSKLAGNTDLWNSGALENDSEFGTSGFTALPGGYRHNGDGNYVSMGNDAYFWSATEVDSSLVWYRKLHCQDPGVRRNGYDKADGYVIRLVKDDEAYVETPQNLNATAGDTQITLDWDDTGEADLAKYRIYRGLATAVYTSIDSVTSGNPITSAYTDNNVINGTTYYYAVRAVNDAGYASDYSNEVEITIPIVYSGPVWHVSVDGSDETGTGTTDYPFETLQFGIDQMINGDTLLLHPGIYYQTFNSGEKSIAIIGTMGSDNTIIDFQNFNTAETNENILFVALQEDIHISIEGIAFRNKWSETQNESFFILRGETNHPLNLSLIDVVFKDNFGQAIEMLHNVSLEIDTCFFINNHAGGIDGGAIKMGDAPSTIACSLTVNRSSFSNNSASKGGAIYAEDGYLLISGSFFNNNNDNFPGTLDHGGGGALFIDDSCRATIQNSSFTQNTAQRVGGAISIHNFSIVNIAQSAILNNEAVYGGGIVVINCDSVRIDDCDISYNNAGTFGGGIVFGDGISAIINNSIISNNVSGDHAGGIYCSPCELEINNTEITDNSTSEYGAGLYLNFTNPVENTILNNVTISGNDAGVYAGGIFMSNQEYVEVILSNSIIWGNEPHEVYMNPTGNTNQLTVNYSNIRGGLAGIAQNGNGSVNWQSGNIDAAPSFTDGGNGDYSLLISSPCIDSGNPDLDEDGYHWGVDLDDQDEDGTRLDIGALSVFQEDLNPENNSLAFDGIDDFVSVPYEYSPETIGQARTIAAWVRPEDLSPRASSSVGEIAYAVALTQQITASYSGAHWGGIGIELSEDPKFQAIGYDGQVPYTAAVGSTTPIVGEWSHLALVFNGSTLKLFVNGIEEGSQPFTGFSPTSIGGNAALVIGNHLANQEFNYSFPGFVDGVKLWNRALLPPELRNLVSSAPSISLTDSLIGDWRLDEGDGNIIFDQSESVYSTDGTISGGIWSRLNAGSIDYRWRHFVSTTGSNETGDGSEAFPYATIQFGIDAVRSGDTVLVQPGTYVENINYNGKNIVVGSLTLTTGDTSFIVQTTIDGNQSGSVVTFGSAEDSTAVLIGFTIRNGRAANGGGVICYNTSPQIVSCKILGNTATNLGGGLCFQYNAQSRIENCVIDGNAANYGGGIYCEVNSDIKITDVVISGNIANVWGGGFYCTAANPLFNRVLVDGNSAAIWGGIYFHGTEDTETFMNNVTITNNYADDGGALLVSHSSTIMTARNCIIWGNSPSQVEVVGGDLTFTINYSDIQNGWEGIANIDIDPLFVDSENNDYSLNSESPCIDTGDPDSPQDPDGTRSDMGAFYYHHTASYNGPVWHVSTEGSDEMGDGSISNPFASIQQGVNQANQNDTISIGRGTFSESINIQSKSLYLGGIDSSETIIAADAVYSQAHIEGQVVSFQNLRFESNGTGGDYMLWAECTDCTGADSINVQFVDVSAEGSNEKGFLLTGQRTRLNVQNSMFNNFHPPTGAWDGGVFALNNSYASFDHCAFKANQSNGAGQVLYATDSSSVNINFSSFSGNGSNPGAIALSDGSNLALSNSILWGTPNFQIVILDAGDACSVSIDYCDIANGLLGIDDQSSDLNLSWGEGNFSQDPQFLPENDFRLQMTSPCIDAGDPDLNGDGNSWEIDVADQDPDGTRFDMGAFYYDQRDTIPPELTLNIPDITELIHNGDTLTVTWSASDNVGLDWAKLFFSSNAGESFSLSDSVDANLGEIEWIAPNVISNDCNFAIWVSDLAGNISADTLNGSFFIDDGTAPSISILNPTNQTSVKERDTLLVAWEAGDNVGIEHFEFSYSKEPRESFQLLDVIPSDTSTYSLVLDFGVSDSARIKMIVLDLAGNSSEDVSDYFSITDNTPPRISNLLIPDTTEWGIGSYMDISVFATDNVEITGLDLNYSLDDGSSWLPIVEDLYPVAGRPTYSWLIPDIPGECRVQAIVSDAVGLTDTRNSGMFTVVIEYPQLVGILPQIKPTMDMQLHFSQSMGSSDIPAGTQLIGSVGGEYEIAVQISGQDVTLSSLDGFVSLDTIMLVLSASEWTNSFGYGLDGNGNGTFEGSPDDNDTSFVMVSAAGDYDQNGLLDFDDFSDFVLAWKNDVSEYELYPHQGSVPFINIQPDSSFNVYDLATFASMWNWVAGVSLSAPLTESYQYEEFISEQNGNELEVSLPLSDFVASQTIIKYDPSLVQISVADNGLAKVSSSALSMVDTNPDSGFILITRSHLADSYTDELQLILVPDTKQRYTIEIAFQASSMDANVVQKKSLVELLPIPTSYSLAQNYPNPFNASTTIEYGLPKNSDLSISIYDIRGRFVKDIYSGEKQAGYHLTHWDASNESGRNVASGLYFILLQTPEYRVARKALILK